MVWALCGRLIWENRPLPSQSFRCLGGVSAARRSRRILKGDNGEYLWLPVTDIDDKLVHGKLDNDPASLKKVKRGQTCTSPSPKWMTGFTALVLAREKGPAKRRSKAVTHSDFLTSSPNPSAGNELIAPRDTN